MKFLIRVAIISVGLLAASVPGQTVVAKPDPTPSSPVSSSQREMALAAMLEGQRFAWVSGRTRSQAIMASNAGLAKAAFQRAIDIDPTLDEAYAAIAELAIAVPPGDINVGLDFAGMAIMIDKDNIGAHRIIGRLSTFKSRLNNGSFDPKVGLDAIAAWKEVTRLDPRNAEGWAFLAALYDQMKMPDERIDALRKWVASAQPTEIRFFRQIMGSGEDLMPESASFKLGSALIMVGKMNEAVEVLSLVVADRPNDALAIESLSQALTGADAKSSAVAIQSLQQASYVNPKNLLLSILLAKAQARSGKFGDAILGLGKKAKALSALDPVGTASLEVAAGDLFANAGQISDAVEAYEKALETRGIGNETLVPADMREFAVSVFGKMIDTYRAANRTADATSTIQRARRLLGRDDLFANQ